MPDCSLQCILGGTISECIHTLLNVSSKLLLRPNLLALQESSFVSKPPVCLPESLPGVSMKTAFVKAIGSCQGSSLGLE